MHSQGGIIPAGASQGWDGLENLPDSSPQEVLCLDSHSQQLVARTQGEDTTSLCMPWSRLLIVSVFYLRPPLVKLFISIDDIFLDTALPSTYTLTERFWLIFCGLLSLVLSYFLYKIGILYPSICKMYLFSYLFSYLSLRRLNFRSRGYHSMFLIPLFLESPWLLFLNSFIH